MQARVGCFKRNHAHLPTATDVHIFELFAAVSGRVATTEEVSADNCMHTFNVHFKCEFPCVSRDTAEANKHVH